MTLEGSWKLSDDGVWADDSGNGNDLSETGTVTLAQGHGGGSNLAADMVESEMLSITDANQTGLDVAGALTISCWIRFTSLNAYDFIVQKWQTGGNLSYILYEYLGTAYFGVSSNGSAQTVAASAVGVISANTWYHLAGVYNGTTLQVYVDGVASGSPVAFSSAIYNGVAPFKLGDSTSTFGINGRIDDVRIYSDSDTSPATLYTYGDDFSGEEPPPENYISGTIKNRYGVAIDCDAYNVRVNVYPKNNTTTAPIATQLVTSLDGTWVIEDLTVGIKYLVTFEYEGVYTPTGDTDIAGAEFMIPVAE